MSATLRLCSIKLRSASQRKCAARWHWHHRLLLRSNFCTGSRGYWTETNAARSGEAANFRHRNEFAYPVNTLGKPEAIGAVLKWAAGHSIVGVGRWGKWEHMNSDVAVAEALGVARTLVGR